MRVPVLHRHLLAALLVSLLFLTAIVFAPRGASAQGTGEFAIALSVQPGQVVQLVSLGMEPPVSWSIKEETVGGAITSEGTYTAPSVPGTYHIVGSSQATPGKPCVFTVVVKPATSTEPPLGTEHLYPLPGGGVMRMRYVPSGAFAMGNSGRGDDATLGTDEEKPQHTVTLSGFWIGKSEVTRGQYLQFMKAGGYAERDYWSPAGWAWRQEVARVQPDDWDVDIEWSNPPGPFKQTDDHPVVGVNYYEAEAFCRWAKLRLPTEAEWEKAARWDGQRTRIYAWGDTWDATRCNNAHDPLYPGGQTAPIGSYPQGASACGSLDMLGNVWEWAVDWLATDYYATSPSTNPQGPAAGDLRVIKGGSWFGSNFVGADENDRLRAAQRAGFDPHNTNGGLGFRCAVTQMPAAVGR